MSFAVTLASTFGGALGLSAAYAAGVAACLAIRDRLRARAQRAPAPAPIVAAPFESERPVPDALARALVPHKFRCERRRPAYAGPSRRSRTKRSGLQRQRDIGLGLSPAPLRAPLLVSVDQWA